MSSIFVLIPLSLVLLGLAIWGLLWAIERRQFEDLDTPPWRVVLDDDRAPPQDAKAAPNDVAATPSPSDPDADGTR
jgi:cbb3-type cytochrome oxidase maturation protein